MSLILLPRYASISLGTDSCTTRIESEGKHAEEKNVHTRRTTGDLPALFQTLQLAPAIRLGLALHKIVIERLAAVANKVGCAQ